MASILRSLIWKEWREQRWKLGFGCALLASVTAIGLRSRLVEDFGVHSISNFVGGFLLPLFVAMGLLAAERAGGTLAFLRSLPASPLRVFTVKMVAGALVTAAPFLAAFMTALLIAGEREMAWGDVLWTYLAGAGFGLVVLTWTVTLAVGQPNEARAGLVGLAWLAACVLLIPLMEVLDLRDHEAVWHPIWLLQGPAHARLNPMQPGLAPGMLAAPWCIQGAFAAALLAWAGWRFARMWRTRA